MMRPLMVEKLSESRLAWQAVNTGLAFAAAGVEVLDCDNIGKFTSMFSILKA